MSIRIAVIYEFSILLGLTNITFTTKKNSAGYSVNVQSQLGNKTLIKKSILNRVILLAVYMVRLSFRQNHSYIHTLHNLFRMHWNRYNI